MNRTRITLASSALLGALTLGGPAAAHSPIMVCFANAERTVTCEAGFSDGASATGAQVTIMTPAQRVLDQSRIGKDGTYSFDPPAVDEFELHMTPDSSHSLVIHSSEIVPYEE